MFAAGLLMIPPDPVQATTAVVYEQLNDGAWVIAQGTTFLAQSFTTGSAASSLTDVSVMWRNANITNSGSVASTYSVSIWSDSGTGPASQLASAASNANVSAWAQETTNYSLSTPLSLAANTRYFVVVTGSASGTFGWKCNAATPTSSVSPTPSFTALTSSNSGSSWSAVGGGCAGSNFNMKVTTAIAVAPTLSAFTNVTATAGDAAIAIVAPTANVAGTFSYASSNTSVVSISGGTYNVVGAGSATITATFTPTDTANYSTATIQMTITVAAAPTTTTSTTTTLAATTTAAPITTSAPPSSVATTTITPAGTSTVATLTTAARTTPRTTTNTAAPTTTSTTAAATATPTTSTRTSPSSTTGTPPTTAISTTSAPAALTTPTVATKSPFTDVEGEYLDVVIEAESGDPSADAPVTVRATALIPGTEVVVTVYSDPIVLLRGTVDSDGTFEAVTNLPTGLEAGAHVLLVDGTGPNGPVEVAGTFALDADRTFARIVQPRTITDLAGPSDARLARALELDRPVWDPGSRPLTTGAIVVAGMSLITLAGAGGVSRGLATQSVGGGDDAGGQRRRNAKGKLAGVVTKKLKGIQVSSAARGDQSSTWRIAGTAATDEFSRNTPIRLGRWSAAAPRVFVDGAWSRAMFGSLGFGTWAIGMILGVVASFADTHSPLTPAATYLTLVTALGVLDAGAGACAWITMVVLAIATGSFGGWPDVRTSLGLGVLLATPSLLAHVIRPLRRYVASNKFEKWERVIDYIIVPVFVAFATGSMLKALNGLSGLEIVSKADVSTLRWVVGFTIIARLGIEDVAAHLYPERMTMVQPAKLISPSKSVTGISILIRSLVFLMVCEPFFGVTTTTITATVLLAIPVILKLWEDDLPNSAFVHKWLPRGHFRFLCTLIIGAYLTMKLIGSDGGEDAVRSSLAWLIVPGTVIGVVELFGRSGGAWPNVALRRFLGAFVWLTAVAIVTGHLNLFT